MKRSRLPQKVGCKWVCFDDQELKSSMFYLRNRTKIARLRLRMGVDEIWVSPKPPHTPHLVSARFQAQVRVLVHGDDVRVGGGKA